MSTEIWRTPIVNGEPYEDYQVSNLGRIMSLNYGRTRKPKLRSLNKTKSGYLQVQLSKNKKKDKFYVHRIVAETFLPNPDNLPQVNHKIEGDEGKTMNFVFFNEDGSINKEKTTIEWVTAKENTNYGTRNKRAGKTLSKTQTNGKHSKPVLQFTLDGKFVREWPSAMECGRNGFITSCVIRCCNGERKSHKGFIWRYKEDY